jgi:hypothetical protein
MIGSLALDLDLAKSIQAELNRNGRRTGERAVGSEGYPIPPAVNCSICRAAAPVIRRTDG